MSGPKLFSEKKEQINYKHTSIRTLGSWRDGSVVNSMKTNKQVWFQAPQDRLITVISPDPEGSVLYFGISDHDMHVVHKHRCEPNANMLKIKINKLKTWVVIAMKNKDHFGAFCLFWVSDWLLSTLCLENHSHGSRCLGLNAGSIISRGETCSSLSLCLKFQLPSFSSML